MITIGGLVTIKLAGELIPGYVTDISGPLVTLVAQVGGESFEFVSAQAVPVYCQWFARCDNIATGYAHHTILGSVPICDRCERLT